MAVATAAVAFSLLLPVGCVRLDRWAPSPSVVVSDTSYVSDFQRIGVERYAPSRAGQYPAILLLYGSDGTEGGSVERMRRYADALAAHGYMAYVIHYFDRTGDTITDDSYEEATWPLWRDALVDGVSFAERDRSARPRRVAVVGYSLGAWMALATAAAEPRIRAVVSLGGGFFDTLLPQVRRLPPTLLLHGDHDGTVPLERAEQVDSALDALHVAHELIVYPGQGHAFTSPAEDDAFRRTLEFLDEALKRR